LVTQDLSGKSIHDIHQLAREQQVPACALAGLDIALWDWLGKKAGLPLYRLLGLGKPSVPTSVTIGINPPEVVRERVPLLLDGTGIKFLKIKLGSPEGLEADQAMFSQVVESTRNYDVKLRVDANGGWRTDDAIFMMKWLSERNTDYVEQPLKEGEEADLPRIFKNRPLPIFVDESCRFSSNIPGWADCVDGVNLKLMKCGGITEALRIIAVARAFGLQTMIGCMGESSMSISAGAAITELLDHVDLDSHLNLDPDPCSGAQLVDGIIVPNELPGHGASITCTE
jgi:muconate cycloisomerase